MILNDRDFDTAEWTDFPGLDDVSEPEQNDRALVVRNVVWERHYVQTRPGVTLQYVIDPTSPPPGGVTATGVKQLVEWPTASYQRLLLLATAAASNFVTHLNMTLGTREDILTGINSAYSNLIAEVFGSRMYFALQTDAGAGYTYGYVANGLFAGGVGSQTDTLFQAPFTNVSMAVTTPDVGEMTAGDHKVALVYLTNNGYETKAHVISDVATAVDGQNMVITITPGSVWPAWVDDVKLLLAPVSNQNTYYFVPIADGGLASATPGTTTPIQFTISISDDVLSLGTNGDDWLDLATASQVGAIRFLTSYGDRMVYITERSDALTLSGVTPIIISERGDPQRVWLFRSEKFLPSKLEAVAAFELYNTLYVLGPSWTYAFNDTTGYPVEWATPDTISESVGVRYAGCVSRRVSKADAVQVRFVAAESGMYAFTGGTYSQLPMSYWQTKTYKRINWEAPSWCFEVTDDQENQRVYFLVPLDEAVQPSHILTWDYKKGMGRNSVRFSLDNYAHADISGIELIKHPTTKRTSLWFCQPDGTQIWRQMDPDHDANPYNDAGVGIQSIWQSMKLAPVAQAPQRFAGVMMNLRGAGIAALRMLGYRGEPTRGPWQKELETAPKHLGLTTVGFNSETAYLEISNQGVANAWWRLGWLKRFSKKFLGRLG